MSRKYYKRDKDILDSVEEISKIAIKAHNVGGMPLVFIVIGVLGLILVLVSLFLKFYFIWTAIFVVFTVGFFGASIYFYQHKKKEFCPNCGKELIMKNGRYGKFYACPGFPVCKFVKSIN